MNIVEINDIDVTHKNTMVICKNKAEHYYMAAWLETHGIQPPLLAEWDKYPIAIGVVDDTWTNFMDRAVYYVRFADFITLTT